MNNDAKKKKSKEKDRGKFRIITKMGCLRSVYIGEICK